MIRALLKGTQDRRYDVNGDGVVDWHDLKLMIKCVRKWEKPWKHEKTKTPAPTKTPKPDKATKTRAVAPD